MKIQTRYETIGLNGKTWTKWFNQPWGKCETKEEAEEIIKSLKAKVKDIDSNTKLKHEFRIVNEEELVN